MFKIFLVLLFMTAPAWSQQWEGGTGEQTILGTSQSALIGFNSYNKIVNPLNNLLATYCNQYMVYKDSSDITISPGSVMVASAANPPVHLMLINTSPTVINWTNIDTGSMAANTTYYVYAVAATNSTTIATYFISASNTAPSGQTYYYQIGSFATDANTQMTNINNNWSLGSSNQLSVSKSSGVVYQALTDIFVGGWANTSSSNQTLEILTGSISGSMTTVQVCGNGNTSQNTFCSVGWNIRKGDFYELLATGTSGNFYALATSK